MSPQVPRPLLHARKRLAVEKITFEAMWRLRESIHCLEELSVSDIAIQDDELALLLPCCPNVTRIGISCCHSLTTLKGAARCPLTALDLSNCSSIVDGGLKEISHCPLTNLNLSCCFATTDGGMKEISRCPLTTLDLCGWQLHKRLWVERDLWLPVARSQRSNLSRCRAITDTALKELASLPAHEA